MKQAKNALVLQSILAMGAIWVFIALYRSLWVYSVEKLDTFVILVKEVKEPIIRPASTQMDGSGSVI